ncbi:MAG: formylmethanofuran dehydrogenase subunit A [Candidatus Bathyarchaeia archaeon]
MKADLIIKNGFVFDPLNGVDGERMDVLIRKGKIVEGADSASAEIDALGLTVMPGGVDIHSHIAGSKVSAGRLLRPEDHYRDTESKTPTTRSGVGRTTPSTFVTGYRYARMGYTTVADPAVPPIKARHTHEEFNDIPLIDKACYILLGNNWFVLEFLRDGKFEECAAFVAWLLSSLKGYAIKMVNPGGVEAWGWGGNVRSYDDEVPHFNITPRQIVQGLCKVRNLLNLPHTIHVHTNNLGRPGNYETTLETMKSVKGMGKGKAAIHITHCQFNAFAGDSFVTLRSGAEPISNYINKHSHVTMDTGQVIFTRTTTMTADGPFEYILQQLRDEKWVNADIEVEAGGGIVPITYRKRSYVNTIQWSIALELALLVKDPWKVCLTTDHPNGGPFTSYPTVVSWLLSSDLRNRALEGVNPRAKRRSLLPSIDREYSLYEIAIVTRAGTTKSLGLSEKGHLGAGADGDVAIYRIDPTKIDPAKDYEEVRRALQRAAYTVKGGIIVARDGEIVGTVPAATHWVDARLSGDLKESVLTSVKEKFESWYTVRFENYPIEEGYLANSKPVVVRAEI